MICSRCIYDDRIPYITFDEKGVCNYCHQHDQLEQEYPTGEQGMKILKDLAEKIKKEHKNKKYDVVVGVSGGTDSSYMLHLAKEVLGLRVLAAHFDNTWNSKIAVENIKNVTDVLDIDLFTHVVDSKEFNDIFKSFLKASVPESDTVSDIGLATTHYLACKKFGVKYIFEGHSFRNEGIAPPGWTYMDAKYIESIQKQFGELSIKTLPNLWMGRWLKWIIINKIKKIRPLYYIDNNKVEIQMFLKENYGWKDYGGHHMENRASYFANNYWFPKKVGIDLRQCEFSAFVRTEQMKRDEAIKKIKEPHEFDNSILAEIKKRLDISDIEFEEIMNAPNKTYRDYKTYKQRFERMRPLFYLLYKMDLVPKSFYLKYTRKYEDG